MIVPSNDFEHSYTGYNIDKMSYVPPPKPSLNGGLFTGEPFHTNAGYKNYPVTPDAVFMIATNLTSANPPPGAQLQFPDTFRPGNNLPYSKELIPLKKYSDTHTIICSNHK